MDAGRLQGVAVSTACGLSFCTPNEQLRLFPSIGSVKCTGVPCLVVRHHVGIQRKQRGAKSIVIRSAIAHDLAAVAVAAATVLPVCWIYVNRSQLLAGSSSEATPISAAGREKTPTTESSASFSTSRIAVAEFWSSAIAHRLNAATNGETCDALDRESPSAISKRTGELVEDQWLGQSDHEKLVASVASVEDAGTRSSDLRTAFSVVPSSSMTWLHQSVRDSDVDSLGGHAEDKACPEVSGHFLQNWNSVDVAAEDELGRIRSGRLSSTTRNSRAEQIGGDDKTAQSFRGAVELELSDTGLSETEAKSHVQDSQGVDRFHYAQSNSLDLEAPKTEVNRKLSDGKSGFEISQRNGDASYVNSKTNGSAKVCSGDGKPLNGASLRGNVAESRSVQDEDGTENSVFSEIGGTDLEHYCVTVTGSMQPVSDHSRGTIVGHGPEARMVSANSERGSAENGTVNKVAQVAWPMTSETIPITKLTRAAEVKNRVKYSSGGFLILSEVLPVDKCAGQEFYIKIYEELLQAGRLRDCVLLLEEMHKLKILDSDRIFHTKFFKACKRQKAVKEAFRFMRLLKRPNLKTYNMLLLICRDARDVDGGLRVLSAAEKAGLKPDVILYTTLISTCAKAGKVDMAFKVFHDMQNVGVIATIETYGAMIDGCALAGQIAKAFGVYGIMISKKLKPDHAIFNTLIKACGRVGAIERAFDVLADMRAEPCFLIPNHVTVGALISACARAGQVERAFEVYRNMSKWGIKGTAECYTAAVHACSPTGDLDLALSVYEDMKREGVSPDEVLFSSLIDVAGHSKQIDNAFRIMEEMKKVAVIPGPTTYSALMGVCCNTGNWERGLELYKEIREAKLLPTISTFNALITALCDAKQIQQSFAVFQEMKEAGVQADQVTYSILLDACEKLGEPEKAFDIYATGRAEGVVPNEAMCASVIAICYANIKKRRSSLRYPCSIGLLGGQSHEVPYERWAGWAIAVFRHAVAANAVPTIKTLSLLLGCLRIPERRQHKKLFDDMLFHPSHSRLRPLPILDGASLYDPRASAILQEAASMGVVPQLNYTAGPVTMNAESMPSYVAEVYLVTLLKGLKERHMEGAQLFPVTITFSTETKHSTTARNESKSVTVSGRAGQGLAALLRRLKLHFHGHVSSGKLRIETASIRKWLKPAATFPSLQRHQELGFLGPPHTFLAQGIAEQQRAIRMGQVSTNSAHIYRNPAKVAQVNYWDRGPANNS